MGKRRRKPGGKLLLFIMLPIIGLFVCAGLVIVGGFIWYFTRGGSGVGPSLFGGPSGPFSAEMKHLPDNCGSFHTRRMDQLLASPAYQKLRDQSGDVKLVETADVRWQPIADVERVTWAYDPAGGTMVMMTLKKPVTGEQVRAANSGAAWNTETVNGHTLYTNPSFGVNVVGGGARELGDGFCVVEGNVILYAPAVTLRPILQRNGAPKLHANMTKALQTAHFDRSIVHMRACNEGETWIDKDNPFSAEVKLPAPTRDLEIKITETNVDQDVTTTVTYVCKGAAAAENLKKQIADATQKVVAAKDEARAVYKNENDAVNGPVLTIVQTQTVDVMTKWFHRKVW